ncbi:transporter substrate-binding domain-containing protein [Spirulina sp. CS-785/01]|uniref:transporter substrate-binding domain-containing protein n=1 Tax=Spirulina sp. CS-785/01 TaxID=3021716 RepID=UPI00232D29EF|nr:transporter substrate-binding domain-containing protein [Spirulina sp. CS-785/01]MDB9315241.1 transporter substrate-binding domain-containing protein [Spirulina sp. CS-785/01]
MKSQFANLSLALTLFISPLSLSPVGAAELATIQQRGKIVIAVKDNLRPLGFRDERGELRGLEIDMARKLAEELLGSAEAVVLKPVSNEARLEEVMEGEVDLAIAHLTATPARARLVHFSRYYYLNSTTFVTLNPDLDSLNDLQGLKVAVLKQSRTIPTVRHAMPNIQLLGVESYQEALEKLETGEVAVFAGDRAVLVGWVQDYPQYRLIPVNLGMSPLSIALPKGRQQSELYLRVNRAIAQWETSGWLPQRREYWGLDW